MTEDVLIRERQATVNARYPHAAPAIREQLCRTVRIANDAKTVRDRSTNFARAYGFARALQIMAASEDTGQLMEPGIANEKTLWSGSVALTREWLGHDADKVLGPAKTKETNVGES